MYITTFYWCSCWWEVLGEFSCCSGLKVNRKYLILLVCLLVKNACLGNLFVVVD